MQGFWQRIQTLKSVALLGLLASRHQTCLHFFVISFLPGRTQARTPLLRERSKQAVNASSDVRLFVFLSSSHTVKTTSTLQRQLFFFLFFLFQAGLRMAIRQKRSLNEHVRRRRRRGPLPRRTSGLSPISVPTPASRRHPPEEVFTLRVCSVVARGASDRRRSARKRQRPRVSRIGWRGRVLR